MWQHEVRNAAEALLQSNTIESQNAQTPSEISYAHSINALATLRPELFVSTGDYFAGLRFNGRMSNIRRFFCLFVTFDLTFISLMWLIIMMIDGENILDALREQVVHYDIHKSLFDIVLLALSRFIILLLFYALVYIHHWIVIALTTTGTCAFLISKVFVYDWHISKQQVFPVLLVLVSFVLAWGETWFLDYKVLPQELAAEQIVISTPESDRAPLIRRFVQGLPSAAAESVANFYSLPQSPEGSMHQFDVRDANRSKCQPVHFTADEVSAYVNQGKRALSESWILLNRNDWKKAKESNGDLVFSLVPTVKGRKIFKLISKINMSAKFLFEELYYRVESIPEWNPALIQSQRVQILNEYTDISYQISANGAGGAVSSRDFVNVRHWSRVEDCYVIASTATTHPSIPKSEKYVRGENGSGCCVMRPLGDDCQFEWVLNTDLKGWVSSAIVEKAFANMMLDYVANLRKYSARLRQAGRFP